MYPIQVPFGILQEQMATHSIISYYLLTSAATLAPGSANYRPWANSNLSVWFCHTVSFLFGDHLQQIVTRLSRDDIDATELYYHPLQTMLVRVLIVVTECLM